MGTILANPRDGIHQIERYDYPESPWTEDLAGMSERLADPFPVSIAPPGGISGSKQTLNVTPGAQEPLSDPVAFVPSAEWIARMGLECREAEERGRILGVEAGLAMGRDEASRHVEAEQNRLYAQAGELAESFAVAQAAYFHQVEGETVHLALAIAARILRREAQMDPLLLTGAVRVALGQLAESTTVRIRVPAPDEAMWKEALSLLPGISLRPQVIADQRLELGECRMETEIGSVNLGLWSQLKEIERGFFDRVGDRAGPRAGDKSGGVSEEGSKDDGGRVGVDDEGNFAGRNSSQDQVSKVEVFVR
jgi:flagellar assembly protein FliH